MPNEMNIDEAIHTLNNILSCEDDLHTDYSGRGMYGDTCVAIYTDTPDHIIEEAAEQGIKGSRTDNMGKRYVVYWPRLKTNGQEG